MIAIALAAALPSLAQFGFSRDERLVSDLKAGGVVEKRTRSTVWFEEGALSEADRKELADLVDRGVHQLEKYLGGPYGWQRWPRPHIEYFVGSRVGISRVNSDLGPSVLLSLDRVRTRDAPYLHETVHVLTAALLRDERRTSYPMWREEGFASFVADEIARTGGGWRFGYMTHGGNPTVHRECADLLDDPQTSGVDDYIGMGGQPRGREMWSRPAGTSVAPARRAMYVCGQSYVKFLVDSYGLKAMLRLLSEADTVEGQGKTFGKPVERLREEWHQALRKARA